MAMVFMMVICPKAIMPSSAKAAGVTVQVVRQPQAGDQWCHRPSKLGTNQVVSLGSRRRLDGTADVGVGAGEERVFN
jgi:hypothetical protein